MRGGVLIFALDVELSGCQLDKDNILAIGWYVINAATGDTVDQGCVSLEPIPGRRPFEERCLKEFWSLNDTLLKEFQRTAMPPMAGIGYFFSILNQLDKEYDVRIVSDNPSSDIAWIDYYGSKFLDRKPMCYRLNTSEWRPVYCTDSYARAAAKVPYKCAYTDNKAVMVSLGIDAKNVPEATHHPTDDARSIAVMHRLVYLAI